MISPASIVTDKKTKTGARQEVITLNTFLTHKVKKKLIMWEEKLTANVVT